MPNDRPSAVPSWAAQVQLFRVRVLIRPSTYQVRTMQKEAVMTMNRLNEIAARAEAASKELDRLAGGNPGTNWRWSIPAQPDRDTDLILSASQMDVPRLVSALRAVEAVVSERYKLWAAICGETCGKEVYGIDHDAIADSIAASIETAIREALS